SSASRSPWFHCSNNCVTECASDIRGTFRLTGRLRSLLVDRKYITFQRSLEPHVDCQTRKTLAGMPVFVRESRLYRWRSEYQLIGSVGRVSKSMSESGAFRLQQKSKTIATHQTAPPE